MSVTAENAFIGGCTFLENIYGVCDCYKHIYGWFYIFGIYLWVGVSVCGCLRHIYGRVYLKEDIYGWV